MKFNFGDKIKLTLKSEEELEGLFVPSTDKEFIIIKLDSGYNQAIKLSNVKLTELLEEHKVKIKKHKELKQDKSLPLIILLHVGGTIASKVDYSTGGVSAQMEPDELLDAIPELKNIARIKTKILSNTLSENIRFDDYNVIAKEILESLDENIVGVIISHGTDTLHYSTAALSFMLQKIKIPVVFVGSQRSSDRPSTDSVLNLISAAKFISDQVSKAAPLTGVFASMHSNSDDDYCDIYSGLNLRKLHSSRRGAFKQINSSPVAQVYSSGKINYSPIKNIEDLDPLFEPAFFRTEIKVGILKSHPNLFEEELSAFKNFDGLIIEGTGLGHLPVESDSSNKEHKKISSLLVEMSKKIPIVISSQCINGSTNLNIYRTGRIIKRAGVLEAGAIITETAFIKLAWLLSNFPKDEIKEMWERNFVGEVISRNLYEKE